VDADTGAAQVLRDECVLFHTLASVRLAPKDYVLRLDTLNYCLDYHTIIPMALSSPSSRSAILTSSSAIARRSLLERSAR